MDDLVPCPVRGSPDALLTFLAEPSPATYMAAGLQVCAERQWTFERAWAHLLRTLPRDMDSGWRDALKAARPQFRRAYPLL